MEIDGVTSCMKIREVNKNKKQFVELRKSEFSQFFISVFFLFQLINRPIVEITKINADVREKIPSVTTNMINVANGI